MFSEGSGDRIRNADNVVIVITDGQSTYDRHLTIPEADALKVRRYSTNTEEEIVVNLMTITVLCLMTKRKLKQEIL